MLLILCFSRESIAQQAELRFEKIGFEQGLSNETVTAILQDSKGFLWFGTFDGLYKYDGYDFTKYQFDPNDPNSISQNLIYTIFEDKYGTLWVSTFEGLCKFDRTTEKFTRYKPSPDAKFSNPNIWSINEDANGMMWVGSTSGELCRFNRETGQFLDDSFDLGFRRQTGESPILIDMINCIYKDRAGILWVGNTTGLHRINLTSA